MSRRVCLFAVVCLFPLSLAPAQDHIDPAPAHGPAVRELEKLIVKVASVIGRTRQEVVQRTGIRIHVAPDASAGAQQLLGTLPHVTDVTATR